VTRRASRWILFGVLLLTLPVPFYLGEVEYAPVLRLAFLASLLSAVAVAEGGGTLSALATLGGVQVLVLGALLFLAAALLARLVSALPAPVWRTAAVAVLVTGLLCASAFEVYDTPLSSTRPRSNLAHLFE
jgi:hypothetical protein